LENRRSQNDEVSGGVWKVVETGTREIRVEKAKEREREGRSWEKKRRKEEEKENKKEEDNGGVESGRGIGDMG